MPDPEQSDELIFPNDKKKPLSDMTLSAVLKRMQYQAATPHGFRSTFRQWAADRTSIAREAIELALAHVVGNTVEQAYSRDADMLERRRPLMQLWADYCAQPPVAATVTPIRKGGTA